MLGGTGSAGQVRGLILTDIRTFWVLGRSWVEKINLDDGPWRLVGPLFMWRLPCQTACHVAVAHPTSTCALAIDKCVEGAELATAARPDLIGENYHNNNTNVVGLWT